MPEGKGTYGSKVGRPPKKKKKNVVTQGKETNITLRGPATVKSDLRGGALDEIVAPIAENLRNSTNEMISNLKESGKRAKKGIYNYFDRPRNGKSKYNQGE
jgi:hypothetical protein